MKLRAFLYFLIYPFLGPLVGYLSVLMGFLIYLIADKGLAGATSQLQREFSDAVLMSGFAYIFGGVQAIATGIYAARALVKYGRSSLATALGVAATASICVVLIAALAEGARALRLIIFMLPPALISTIVLYQLERYFRMPNVQAKS